MTPRRPAADPRHVQVSIRVQGGFGRNLMAAFDELDGRVETVLTGPLADDAALHGVLNRLAELGVKILDVHVANPHGDAPASSVAPSPGG
jgi:hypothetical protein